MTTYKLSNIIKRHFIHDKWGRFKGVKKQKLSFSYLRDLCYKYYVSEYTEHEYCCKSEDYNCWIEVHSSWMKYGEKMTDKEFCQRVYSVVKVIINSHLTKSQIGKRSMFVSENDKCIVICIPLRDVSKSDYWLVFDKQHLV